MSFLFGPDDMALYYQRVTDDMDFAQLLALEGALIAPFIQKQAGRLSAQGDKVIVFQDFKLDHVAGIIPKPLYGQQVISPDGELCHTRALRARMSSTGSPYRATRVALTIMRNASASTISGSARSIATGLPAPWYSPFAAEKSA